MIGAVPLAPDVFQLCPLVKDWREIFESRRYQEAFDGVLVFVGYSVSKCFGSIASVVFAK
jgi:hypothetical protein